MAYQDGTGSEPAGTQSFTARETVAIVLPVYNEAAHIEGVLNGLCRDEAVHEIIVVDGGSTDSTRRIVERLASADERIRLLHNPRRWQSAAVNLAAVQALPEVNTLIRADAHSHYPPDFVRILLEEQARSGAASVVNRLRSIGRNGFQLGVAAASNSAFGAGGSVHRQGGPSCFIDHGHHALFDRATFLALGGYDESFAVNEDAEYDVRLRKAGGRIWFTNRADIDYFPRSSSMALAVQYFRYGTGRAKTAMLHKERLRLRQQLPPIMLIALALSLALESFTPAFLIVPAGYITGLLICAAVLWWRDRRPGVLWAAWALPIMHLAWGAGFLWQNVRSLLNKAGRHLSARPDSSSERRWRGGGIEQPSRDAGGLESVLAEEMESAERSKQGRPRGTPSISLTGG